MILLVDKQSKAQKKTGFSLFSPFVEKGECDWWKPSMQLTDDDNLVFCVFWNLSSIEALLSERYAEALQNRNYKNESESIVDDKLVSELQKPNRYLLLYNDWECRDLTDYKEKLQFFTQFYLKLPLEKAIYSTCDYRSHMRNQFPLFSFDWVQIRETAVFTPNNIVPKNEAFRHKIISFNFRGSYERLLYCYYLSSKHGGCADYSYINVPPLRMSIKEFFVDIIHFKDSFTELKRYFNRKSIRSAWLKLVIKNAGLLRSRNIKRFKGNFPKLIDGDGVHLQHQTETIANALYSSFVTVIFETNSLNPFGNACQISEKSYLGIKTRKPFILFSTQGGILTHLKQLGFQTFSDFFDESYDDQKLSYYQRYKRLLRLTDYICKLSEHDISILNEKMQATLDHNLHVLQSTAYTPSFFEFVLARKKV